MNDATQKVKRFSDLTDEEKNKIILIVADDIIKNNSSIRKATENIVKLGIKVSHPSIHDNLHRRLPKISQEKYDQVVNILNNNKPKTIEDRETEQRVNTVGILFLQDYTIEKIAEEINSTPDIVYRDLKVRLPKMFPHMFPDIQKRLEQHSLNSLIPKEKKVSESPKQEFNELKKTLPSTLEEMAYLCLTYRISFENLKFLLKYQESVEEIKEYFIQNNLDLKEALYYLDLETKNESEEIGNYAKKMGYEYLKKRKIILINLAKAKKKNDKDEIIKNKEMLKRLKNLIYDSVIKGAIGKKFSELTEEEKEAIPRYRLKYGLSRMACSKALHIHKKIIDPLEHDLAEKDPIFKIKLELLMDYYEQVKKEIIFKNR